MCKKYTKYLMVIAVDSRIILYLDAVKDSKHGVRFAIASIMSLKKYNH